MILSCPSCKKRFLLDARLLGTGRNVKCGNCGHVWHQTPPPPEKPGAKGSGKGGAAKGAAKAPAKPAPKPAAKAPAKPSPKPAAPKPPPPPPPPPADDDLLFEPPPPPPAADPADAFTGFAEPEPMRPRPMPRGSNLPAPLDQGGSRKGAILRWGGLGLAVAAVGAGLYFGRPQILELWPPSAQLYAMIGMPVEPLGAGLAIPTDKVKVEVRDIEGAALLFATGEIANTGDQTRTVPDIKAIALDQSGKELFSWRIMPSARRLFPGQSATFESRVPERGGAAANIGFEFIEPEAPPAPAGK